MNRLTFVMKTEKDSFCPYLVNQSSMIEDRRLFARQEDPCIRVHDGALARSHPFVFCQHI